MWQGNQGENRCQAPSSQLTIFWSDTLLEVAAALQWGWRRHPAILDGGQEDWMETISLRRVLTESAMMLYEVLISWPTAGSQKGLLLLWSGRFGTVRNSLYFPPPKIFKNIFKIFGLLLSINRWKEQLVVTFTMFSNKYTGNHSLCEANMWSSTPCCGFGELSQGYH